MRARAMQAVLAASLLFLTAPALAANPQDISLIGNMQYLSDFKTASPVLDRLRLGELELSYQGYLSPSARADVFISLHPDDANPAATEVEPEEVYVSLLDLPLDSSLRIGKFRPSFGKLNRFHDEQWFTVDQPLVLEQFLGEDGLQDLGAELSVRIPNPWDLFFQLNAAAHGGSPIVTPAAGALGKAGSFRLSGSFDVTDDAYVETGLSGLAGAATASAGTGTSFLGAADLTFRWRPDRTSSFTTSGEFLAWERLLEDSRIIMPSGFYVVSDYQFATHHDLGVRADHTWTADPGTTLLQAASAFYTFSPWEFNKYRIEAQHRWAWDGGLGGPLAEENRVMLQVLLTLGPHKHPVQF